MDSSISSLKKKPAASGGFSPFQSLFFCKQDWKKTGSDFWLKVN